DLKAEILERLHKVFAIGRILFHIKVRILRGIGKSQQDGPGFSDEQVLDVVTQKYVADFLCLSVFKCAHSPTSPAGSVGTIGDTLRWFRRNDTGRHPEPAYRC